MPGKSRFPRGIGEDLKAAAGQQTATDDASGKRKPQAADVSTSASVDASGSASITGGAGRKRKRQAEPEADALLRVPGRKAARYEDTHTKQTYWLENDLIEALPAFCERTGLSKSEAVNRGLHLLMRLVDERGATP